MFTFYLYIKKLRLSRKKPNKSKQIVLLQRVFRLNNKILYSGITMVT